MPSVLTRLAYGLVLAAASLPTPAAASTYELASTGGLLQQPTSHYYLAFYGADAVAATDSERFIVRASYLQRPQERDAGYLSSDYAFFGTIGTKVTKEANRGLYAYLGVGRVGGYVKVDRSDNATSGQASTSYQVSGLTTSVDYAFKLRWFDVAFGHQVLVGYVNREQSSAYVAWPYMFFHASLGIVL